MGSTKDAARNFLEDGSKSSKMLTATVGGRKKLWVMERIEW